MVRKIVNILLITNTSKQSAYRKDFDKTKYMYFLIKNYELLEKYDRIWGKFRNVIKKGYDGEPVYKDKHLKTKIKSCERKININFHDYKVPKNVLNAFVYL